MQVRKRTQLGIALFTLVLTMAACGGRTATVDTNTETTPTQAQQTVTVIPTSSPVVVLPDASGVAASHIDAALISDVIVVNAGEPFTQNWHLRNTGVQEWSDTSGEYRWVFVGGNQMNGPSQIRIAETVPVGGGYDVVAQLTAPATPGQYEGRWQLFDSANEPVSSEFVLQIEVQTAVTDTPSTGPVTDVPATDTDASGFVVSIDDPATDDDTPSTEPITTEPPAAPSPVDLPEGCLDATVVADVTIPDGTVLKPGETFTKIWRIRNIGSCDWSDALGDFQWVFASGNQMSGPNQVPIAAPVPSGGDYDVEVELTAPLQTGQQEGYWRVQGPNGDSVGVLFWVLIEVRDDSVASSPGGTSSSGSGSSDTRAGDASFPDAAQLAQEVWQHINGERDRQGLYQLAYNEKLALAAQLHAQDCFQRGSCSHAGSDGSDEATRVRRVGYEGSVDESWVWSASPWDAVAWWLDEVPPNDWHRRMLLSEQWRQVGVGVAPTGQGGYYFIAVFGKPGS
jgi:uncharacterized protein YkwD